jgi:hypothetical protein
MPARATIVAMLLAAACGDGASHGTPVSDDPDAAAAADGATPDATPPGVPFEDRSWGDLEVLDEGEFPQVAIDSAGDLMTLWEVEGEWPDYEWRCFARRRTFESSAWDEHDLVTPDAVSAGLEKPDGTTLVSKEDYLFEPDALAVDASGDAVAIFTHSRLFEYEGGARTTWESGMRATFDPGSGWTEPEWFGVTTSGIAPSVVAMNAQGTGALAWLQLRRVYTDDNRLKVAGYEVDEGWRDPVVVDQTADLVAFRKVMLDDLGDGLGLVRVYASLADPALPDHLSVARLEGGTWHPPEPVDDADYGSTWSDYDMAMNSHGTAILVWRRCDGSGACQRRARRFQPDGGWEEPVTVAEEDEELNDFDGPYRVAIDDSGNALAVWGAVVADPDTGRRQSAVLAARFRDGEWMAPETVATRRVWNVRVALDAAGDGLIAWSVSSPYDPELDCNPHQEYRARTYTPASGFGPTTTLEVFEGCHLLTWLALAVNRAGVGAAAWSADGVGRVRMFR